MLPLLREAWVQFTVPVKGRRGANFVVSAELANTGLEEIFLDRPAHEVVVD
jgi:hypothetical protein